MSPGKNSFNQGAKIFKNSKGQPKILGARMVTISKLHTEDPQILDAVVHYLVVMATGTPGIVQP
jgi:hypothetical protein